MAIQLDYVSNIKRSVAYYPAKPELIEFCMAVEDAVPGAKTKPRSRSEALVYNPHDLVAMGVIGYDDYGKKPRGNVNYMVASPNIDNTKYNAVSFERHIVLRKHLKPAVAAAVEYLTNPDPSFIADMAGSAFRSIRSTVRAGVRSTNMTAHATVFGPVELARYKSAAAEFVARKLAAGDTLGTPELDAAFNAFMQSSEDYANLDGHITMQVILVRQNTVTVGLRDYADSSSTRPLREVEHYRPEEVPQHIAGRIAILNMVGDGQYVAGVGVKLQEGIYYAFI